MKRYTLKFQPFDPSISPAALKDEVEQVLLRLHPRITYKMGSVYIDINGATYVYIAVDGHRKLLEQAFEGKVWSLPVNLESLSWGWIMDNEDAQLLVAANAPFEADPLESVQPIAGEQEFSLSRWRMQGRWLALMLSTLALVAALFANYKYRNEAVWEVLYLVLFAIFIFALNDTPLDIRVYATHLALRREGIEIRFWMTAAPTRLSYAQISGMDYANPVCTLLSQGKKTRLILSERFGCPQREVILKTILERSGLIYVEGNFQKLSYRKPAARL